MLAVQPLVPANSNCGGCRRYSSGRDPGIVPRNANPPILDEYEGGANVNNEQTLRPHLPRAKEVVVNESTYENFRYRYDQQSNPYNKGVAANFREIFCSCIPPSKNNVRSKIPIPKEPSDSSRRRVEEEEESDYADEFTNDEEHGKGSGIGDNMSVDLSRMLHTEGGQTEVASFLRLSLWDRSSKENGT
ncbi:hypothetical protein JHK85_011120 [Glycine max]|nr:hypothetical protein JHK85_011120 [Glycine max]